MLPGIKRLLLSAGCVTALFSSLNAAEPDQQGVQFFETKIRPALLMYCVDCHGEETQESQLRLDTPGHFLAGGKSGPVAVAGEPERSLLISAIQHQDEALQMPPEEKLPESVIADFVKWVKMGTPLPDAKAVAATRRMPFDLNEARKHWAFHPAVRPELPELKDQDFQWSNPIDRFIQARREERQLSAATPATKRVLIRRAYLDLIGLPPTPEQVHAFLSDDREDAFAHVVDDLLASSHYGERWGRHWLDIARYADSNGLDENVAHGNAWRYRDYVIDSFNKDKPYNRFIREQLAGDLLEDDAKTLHERLIATGFLSLGPKVLAEGDETKMQMDIIDEQIDTTGRVFMALTFGCARCHDHKFDPLSTDDYYALAGIFKSTKTMESLKRIAKWNEHVIASEEQLEEKRLHDEGVKATEAKIAELERLKTENTTAQVDATGVKEATGEANSPSLDEQIKQLKAKLAEQKAAVPELPTTMGVVDGEPIDVPIHVRGSHLSLGKIIPRAMPVVLSEDEPTLDTPTQSGRLELANWLASPTHPLTARVWVNRVWRWHFGTGLVPSVDNFGKLGESPTHPDLLNWLAVEFVENGWSTKDLHRLIMSSKTYQMSSTHSDENAARDATNQYYWRMNRQRMEAEVFRDAILVVSGQLDRTMGGSMLHVKNREFIFNHTSKDETNYETTRRSVYLPVIRNNLYDGFSLFDYTDASVPNGNRSTSTVAPQALYALNSPIVLQSAEDLADELLTAFPADTHKRINALYERTFCRLPTNSERRLLSEYVQQFSANDRDEQRASWTSICQTFLISNEFIYVE